MHLDAIHPDALTAWLRARDLLLPGERVTGVARAGEGNMNHVQRVHLGGRSLVLKQARPWVERYPHIPAPVERTEVEAAIYAAIAHDPVLATRLPTLLAHDPDDHVLVLEDLGPTADCTDLYGPATLDEDDLDLLLSWLGRLHALRVRSSEEMLANRAMRRLNHEHVFVLPFRPQNGLDLDAITPGLAAVAHALATDAPLVARIHGLGERYLADGGTLVHGDFYPGSWVRSDRGLVVLDLEFGFLGTPAWDRGVLLGHLLLTGHGPARLDQALEGAPAGTRGFAGVEVLRRLLGVAQLPLFVGLATKEAWVGCALDWLRSDA